MTVKDIAYITWQTSFFCIVFFFFFDFLKLVIVWKRAAGIFLCASTGNTNTWVWFSYSVRLLFCWWWEFESYFGQYASWFFSYKNKRGELIRNPLTQSDWFGKTQGRRHGERRSDLAALIRSGGGERERVRVLYNKRAYNEVNGSPTALTPLSLCARALINRVTARHHYPVKSLMIGRSVAGPWWLSLSAIRPLWRGTRENRASLFLSKLAWPNVIILNAMKAEGAQA